MKTEITFRDTIHGVLYHRDNPWDSGIAREIWRDATYFGGDWEIKPGDNVVDIGAHIGSFAILAGKLGANVWAYEPTKDNFKYLEENIKENDLEGKVHGYNLAITSDGREVSMHTEFDDNNWNTGTASVVVDTSNLNEKAQSETLDAIFLGKGTIDFLKIDCEGAEYEILYGASVGALQQVKLISMEFHHSLQEGKLLSNFLEKRGFEVKLYWSSSPHGLIKAKRIK